MKNAFYLFGFFPLFIQQFLKYRLNIKASEWTPGQ